MMFNCLRNALLQDVSRQKKEAAERMENIELTSWYFLDNLTDTNKEKFKNGTLSEADARKKALEKASRKIDKWYKNQLEKLESVENAKDIHHITANVEFIRSKTWGYNPHATIFGSDYFKGTASGCGYDKESAALADAFNQDYSILKILYTYKEKALASGQDDTSKTACTGHDNRNILGYGSGYAILPYFEGGVGVSCFVDILKTCGFEASTYYGRSENGYNFSKIA